MKNPTSKRPAFPGRFPKMKTFSDERGVSPVIAVILMVAITVVLASVLYVMVSGWFDPIKKTPTVAMDFRETDPENGIYIGSIISIDEKTEFDDVTVTITDISEQTSKAMEPLSNEGTASCGEGLLDITYQDLNENGRLDGADVFTVNNGQQNDIIKLTHSGGNGGQMCEVELP
jgi:flagellin-like protein